MKRMPIWEVRGHFAPFKYIQWHKHHMFPQGSTEWKEFRKTHGGVGASAAAAVLADAASKTVSRKELRDKLCGRRVKPPSAFLESIFAIGQRMEPILRDELSIMLDVDIIESGIFVEPDMGTVQKEWGPRPVALSASLDGIACDWRNDSACLTEFKWRTRPGAGWGPTRQELGTTVWCQVQQQMRVTGLRAAVVYAGSDEIVPGLGGDRNLWFVNYSPGYNNGMFMVYFRQFLLECSMTTIPRREPGLNQKVMDDLAMFMRDTVYRVDI